MKNSNKPPASGTAKALQPSADATRVRLQSPAEPAAVSLSPQERKALKARAHHLDPVVLIGDAGLSPAVLREIDVALRSHELIKVRMSGDERADRAGAADAVCVELGAMVVQQIGKSLVLFRRRPQETETPSKPKKPRGPRKSKKQLLGGGTVRKRI